MAEPEVQTSLPALYEEDETAWLDTMARLVAECRYHEMDHQHLSEFLADMARRDRREVLNRLVTLLAHLLKWEHQPAERSGSWEATIATQRQELADLLESRTLLNHAAEVLPRAYERAVKLAVLETKLVASTFPADCPYSLDSILVP